MNNSIIQAECVNLTKLEHLFIDLEYQKTQSQSVSVYRSRSFNQKNKKHLQLDEIKDALGQIDKSTLKFIYLVGKNSMSHPEFNHILRYCLAFTSVTIFSDGLSINDKKARFLKRVEEEGNNEIVFKIFINHYDEKINDSFSYRGAFRNAVHAVTSLNKYGFNPIFVVKTNEKDIEQLKDGFVELGRKFKFETENINFSFVPSGISVDYNQESFNNNIFYDCMSCRILSKSGVYNCPRLLNDYRGHSGATLKNFSTKSFLETEKCQMCKTLGHSLYINNWV